MLTNFGLFNTETHFCFSLVISFALAIYLWIRLLVAYDTTGFVSVIIGMICFSIQNYFGIKHRREVMAEKYNAKSAFENWKHVLDICQEGVVICKNNKVVYCNKGFEYFFDKTEETEIDFSACVSSSYNS